MAASPPSVLWILVSIVAGGACGLAAGEFQHRTGLDVRLVFELIGTLFLNLLKMVIAPLVAASIITAVAGLKGSDELGRLGRRALVFYVLTSLSAILVALAFVNALEPGLLDGTPAQHLLALGADSSDVSRQVSERATVGLWGTLGAMVPASIVQAAAANQILGIVIFSLLFGAFLQRCESPSREVVTQFWQGTLRVMMGITQFVMTLAPLGIFGLTAHSMAQTGLTSLAPLLKFAACVLLGLLTFAVLVVPLIVRAAANVNPYRLVRAMGPALLTAFSTASSSASLPVSLTSLQSRAGVSERVAGFIMPLGISLNHAGSALYECAGAMFIAQAYGVVLPLSTQFVIVVLALITSMGIAGIPAASLVGIVVILSAAGLPTEAIGALLIVDRLLDMARTTVNVYTDAACAVIVAWREGERGVLR